MPYKNQQSIVVPKETKEKLREKKGEDESWDELLNRLAELEVSSKPRDFPHKLNNVSNAGLGRR